jgi:lactoylglutathione lyase
LSRPRRHRRRCRGGNPFGLCLYTDDIAADLDRLCAAGATLRMKPVDQPWGERMGYVGDPDGNLVMVVLWL